MAIRNVRYVKYTDPRTGKVGYIKQKDAQWSSYKTEKQRRAEDKEAIKNSWLGRLFRKIFLDTPSGKKENYDHLRLDTHSNLDPKRGKYQSSKRTSDGQHTSQDKFQKTKYAVQRKAAPARQERMKDYTLDEVVKTATRPVQRKAAPAKRATSGDKSRRRTIPTRTTPRYSNPKQVIHPDADDTPVTMQNPNHTPATDNIQFRPLNYFGMEDPYGRSAAQAFDDELAEAAARRQAVLDMYGIAPSGSNVSDLTSQYNYGKNMWW